jgi:hypothetical protein
MPIDMKSDMMKICQKVWQVLVKLLGKRMKMRMKKKQHNLKDEDEDEYDEEVDFEGDQDDYDSITIKAVGIDFPMLLHEAIKGIWALLKSGAIKDDEEMAQLIAQHIFI